MIALRLWGEEDEETRRTDSRLMSYAVIVPAARLRYAKRPPNTRGINLNDNIHY